MLISIIFISHCIPAFLQMSFVSSYIALELEITDIVIVVCLSHMLYVLKLGLSNGFSLPGECSELGLSYQLKGWSPLVGLAVDT